MAKDKKYDRNVDSFFRRFYPERPTSEPESSPSTRLSKVKGHSSDWDFNSQLSSHKYRVLTTELPLPM